jgi:hypothetical protein
MKSFKTEFYEIVIILSNRKNFFSRAYQSVSAKVFPQIFNEELFHRKPHWKILGKIIDFPQKIFNRPTRKLIAVNSLSENEFLEIVNV